MAMKAHRGFRLLSFLLIVPLLLAPSWALAAKKALVIGVGAYKNVAQLDGPVDDAKAVYAKFVSLEFNSTLLIDDDVSTQMFAINWGNFLDSIDPGDDVVIYASTHGVEINGTNYLVPIDVLPPSKFSSADSLARSLISVPSMMADLKKKQARAVIWIIDACRDNPFSVGGNSTKSLGDSAGLIAAPPPSGMFIFYAAGGGETALASIPGSNSPNSLFTSVFLASLDKMVNDPTYEIAVSIRQEVKIRAGSHPQHPAYYDELDGIWCFAECSTNPVSSAVATATNLIQVKGLNGDIINKADAKKLSATDLAALHDEQSGNAVFLGKMPVACKDNDVSDRFPFGCSALKSIAANVDAGTPAKSLGTPLTALTQVNLRVGLPALDPTGNLVFRCTVKTIQPGEAVTLSSISINSLGSDKSYWGTVKGDALDCDGKPLSRSVTQASPPIADSSIVAIVNKLQSKDTTQRRAARKQLAAALSHAGDATIEALTSDLKSQPYLYQLGLTVALDTSRRKLSARAMNEIRNLLPIHDKTLSAVVEKISQGT